MLKNYILDLDGTLVNTIEDLGAAINHALSELGFPTYCNDSIKTFVGNGSTAFVIKSLGEQGKGRYEKVYELFMKYYDELCTNKVEPYPGAAEFVEKHSGNVALLTNKAIGQTLQILRKFNWEKHFTCILAGDTVPEKKPHPAGILKIIEDSKWNPSETIMVGDDIPDVGAAQAAGIKIAAILGGFGRAEELLEMKPDYAFASFEEFVLHSKTLN